MNTKHATTATAQATLANTMTITSAALTAPVKAGSKNDHRRIYLPFSIRHRNTCRISKHRPRKRTQNKSFRSRRNQHDLFDLCGIKMTPEYIIWQDHHEPQSNNVWWSPEDVETITGPAIIHTVGYVVREQDDWLAIVREVTEDGWTSNPLVLIKSCIVFRKPLSKGKIKS